MKNNKIYPNVKFGKNVTIGDFCIIGLPPKGTKEGEMETIIGDDSEIRSNTVIYAGNKIGDHFQTGHHVMIRESNTIGNNVSIGTGTCIEHHVDIGDNVRIHSGVFIPEYSTLEKSCWIGPNVVLTNAKYPRSKNVKKSLKGPRVCESAKIGANATILPGVTIGMNSLVGAGSVAVKDVSKDSIVAGNPAKVIGDINENNEYK